MSDTRVTPADVAPAQDNADAQQSEATEAPDWSDLFPDEDPQKVREALDNSRKWEKRAKENKAAADRAAELERAERGEKLQVLDTSRYQLPHPPDDATEEEWHAALINAEVQLRYMDGRLLNLELLRRYGRTYL